MYERSAIVLERYFEKLFGFYKENNLRTNYENYSQTIEEIKEYQRIEEEEEKVIDKFEEVALEIEEVQKRQTKLHESNVELEEQRNNLFNDLGENPNTLDNKLQKIEKKMDDNNEELKQLREKYMKALVIFTERQKERNKNSRVKRTAESNHMKNIENAKKLFDNIEVKDVNKIKRFIELDKGQIEQEVINMMIKNGKNEKVPFDESVMAKAVNERLNIAVEEAEAYVIIYERTRRLLNELNRDDLKLGRYEKALRDISVKLNFLNAKKEYIFGFLDNERMTTLNGKRMHEKLMEEACKNFDLDIEQIDNLYELINREVVSKATKKAYKELYNKTYLKVIEQKERNFEQEVTNIKINIGTVINSNYWRIQGIKNIYNVFLDEVSEKFNKDLSEYKVDEIEDEILPGVKKEIDKIRKNIDNYKNNDYEDIYNDDYEDDYEDKYDDYDDDDKYEDSYDNEDDEYNDSYDDNYEEDDDYYDDDYDNYDKEEDDNEYNDDEEDEDDEEEFLGDNIDEIIRNSRKKAKHRKEDDNSKGLFGKLFNR